MKKSDSLNTFFGVGGGSNQKLKKQ